MLYIASCFDEDLGSILEDNVVEKIQTMWLPLVLDIVIQSNDTPREKSQQVQVIGHIKEVSMILFQDINWSYQK